MIKVYSSADTGAPVVNGLAYTSGVINLLDTILLAAGGYNSGAGTFVKNGSIVTVTRTNHGFITDDVVECSGGETGQFQITKLDANNFTYLNASAATSGSVTTKKAPCSWSAGYTATVSTTTRKSYRSPSSKGYVEITETTATSTVTVSGWETMSASNTGTNQFLLSAANTKSVDTGATPSHWICIVINEVFVYLFLSATSTVNPIGNVTQFAPLIFGEFDTAVSGVDAYNFLVGVSDIGSAASWYFSTIGSTLNSGNGTRLKICKGKDQLTGSAIAVVYHKIDLCAIGNANDPSSPAGIYSVPDYDSGNIVMIQGEIWQGNIKAVRGFFPFLRFSPQSLRTLNGSLSKYSFTSGSYAGQIWLLIPGVSATSQLFIRIK